MSPVRDSVLETIGNTPMVRLSRINPPSNAEIIAKLESFNPMSSVKDRIAYSMIVEAERQGLLRQGMTVIEPTSGNTGIGLAMVCAVKGYRLVLTMPETMSIERRRLLSALGAEVILTDGKKGMKGAVEEAIRIAEERKDYFMPQQFINPANPKVHRERTAKEILEDVPAFDAFVSGVGTGGTITGVGEVLRSKLPQVMIIAVEPAKSPVLSGGPPGPHRIQGIGAGFIPKVLNRNIIDRIIQVSEEDAVGTARELARKEGILAGISSGAALWAAMKIASELGSGKKVVVILPDTGERYLSTELFGDRD
ncbi:MAG: cysteine synthase A [Thermoplasmata archaeon]